jgi:hypothetical protein
VTDGVRRDRRDILEPVLRRLLVSMGVGVGMGTAVLAAAAPSAPVKPRFELSQELEARVAAHHDLVVNAGRSMEDFCKLTADTVQILDPIVLELSQFGGSSDRSSVPFSAIERAYTRTERLVPGLKLVATEEVMLTGIDYRGLAKLAPPEARPLLRAMGSFELGSEGVESWGVRVTDYSICQAPERGRAALAVLAKSWPAAPSCLRDALRARLKSELERMTSWNCFCAAREPALAALRKSAKLLRGLADLGGADLADRWLEEAQAADTRFNCSPS